MGRKSDCGSGLKSGCGGGCGQEQPPGDALKCLEDEHPVWLFEGVVIALSSLDSPIKAEHWEYGFRMQTN